MREPSRKAKTKCVTSCVIEGRKHMSTSNIMHIVGNYYRFPNTCENALMMIIANDKHSLIRGTGQAFLTRQFKTKMRLLPGHLHTHTMFLWMTTNPYVQDDTVSSPVFIYDLAVRT
jgi:hypothetical protein